MTVPRVPKVPWVPMGLVLLLAGCSSQPQSWLALQRQLPGLDPAAREAVIEKFIATKA